MEYHCLLHLCFYLVRLNLKKIPKSQLIHRHMAPSITDQQSPKPNSPSANPGLLAVLAVWSLREPHLPWITVEPNSMSKGIQPVFNHHSKRREGGVQLCLSILWTASQRQHPKLKAPNTHTHINMHSPSNAYSIKSTHSHMPTSKHTF